MRVEDTIKEIQEKNAKSSKIIIKDETENSQTAINESLYTKITVGSIFRTYGSLIMLLLTLLGGSLYIMYQQDVKDEVKNALKDYEDTLKVLRNLSQSDLESIRQYKLLDNRLKRLEK